MRKDDPMPTQLEYRTRRAACVRELAKKMYRGQFSYFTGPKSYYSDKLNDAFPPPKADLDQLGQQMAKLSLEDRQELRESVATSYGQSVRQLPFAIKAKNLQVVCLMLSFIPQ